jgi:hypothetical protein
MPADFPVPRSEIPRIEVSNDEYVARKLQMEGMVEQLVQEYEEFSEVNKRQINLRRWKQVGSREHCKLYRERPKYQTTVGALGNYRKYTRTPRSGSGSQHGSFQDDNASDYSYTGPSSCRSSSSSMSSGKDGGSSGISSRGVARTVASTTRPISYDKLDPQHNAAVIADTMPKMLMIGERPGRLEDAMHSLVARNHEELAFVVVFLHKEVADCAILHTMEAPTEDEPYRYLGYKWFVKPSPATAISKLVKNRDSVYVEYTGVTATSSGEVVGYHIMHSIDIDGFPNFHDRNCVRTSQSMCSIYYQKEANMVEFFMMGNVDIGGTVGQSPFKSIFIADTMFGMPRSIDAGESKRLTELVVKKRRARAATGRTKLAPLCRLCRSEKKGYNIVSLVMCEVCGHTVCSRCRVHKEVFESTGLLGRFNKFDCCKTCVVDISNTHLPTAKPQLKRFRSVDKGPISRRQQQGSKTSTRGRNWATTSAILYEDEEDSQSLSYEDQYGDNNGNEEPRLFPLSGDHHSKPSATSDSTASTDWSSDRTAPKFDSSFDSRSSMVSEISDFDRSFMIIRKPTTQAQMEMTQRERMSRETAFSVEDLEDDWQPDFAKSQINRFSKSQFNTKLARSHDVQTNQKHDMVLYAKGTAGHHYYSSNCRGGSYQFESECNRQPSGRHQKEDEKQLTKHHHIHPRVHNSAPSAGPLSLQRNHSGGSDLSRDDLINRMQHLAQLAEETYHTTKVNGTIFSSEQTTASKMQPVENRNRFFFY